MLIRGVRSKKNFAQHQVEDLPCIPSFVRMGIRGVCKSNRIQIFCLLACSVISVISLDRLCFARTYEKDEIIYALPIDAIPAIKNPEFVPASEAGLDDNEPVIGLTINGESRAYSVYLMNHHEVVNDKVGDDVFAVTWCPLANLAVVYDREIDGKEYTFGVSGKLFKNTLVMFDYETESLWSIAYGKAIDGKLSGKKADKVVNSQKMSWGAWKTLHPDTMVLSRRGSSTVGYDVYRDYHKSGATGIYPVKNKDKRLGAKTEVIGIEVNGRHKAYAFSIFDNTKIVTDEFQGLNLLVYRNKETNSIMVYDRQIDGHVIEFNSSKDFATDSITNTTWDLENGIGIKGSMKGKLLHPVSFITVYWFVWADYYPDTEVFQQS